MVKLDHIAVSLIILGFMIDLYLSTFFPKSIILYPTILLLSGGYLLNLYKNIKVDTPVESNVFMYSVIGILMIGLIGFITPRVFVMESVLSGVTQFQLTLFVVLMAIAEEVFFRGFLQSYFALKLHSVALSIVLQSVVWSVYHTAVYGSHPDIMMYVLLSGIVLGYLTYRSGSLTPSLISHIVINFIASSGGV